MSFSKTSTRIHLGTILAFGFVFMLNMALSASGSNSKKLSRISALKVVGFLEKPQPYIMQNEGNLFLKELQLEDFCSTLLSMEFEELEIMLNSREYSGNIFRLISKTMDVLWSSVEDEFKASLKGKSLKKLEDMKPGVGYPPKQKLINAAIAMRVINFKTRTRGKTIANLEAVLRDENDRTCYGKNWMDG